MSLIAAGSTPSASGWPCLSSALTDAIAGSESVVVNADESPVDLVFDSAAHNTTDPAGCVHETESVRVEVVFILIFDVGEEIFVDVVDGGLRHC